jgi:phosphoribosylformylglycinamidine synthase
MYVDGHLPGRYGETHKVSALETLQFSTTAVIADITKCVTMDSKMPGDLLYVLGTTGNELGGSEYYEHFGYVGLNVPQVRPDEFAPLYQALYRSIEAELVASARGIYRGGLGVHLALKAMAGNLGLQVDLGLVPAKGAVRNDVLLFSESAGRFIVTVDPENSENFEKMFKGLAWACIGTVTAQTDFIVTGLDNRTLIKVAVQDLKVAWKKPFGDLV